MENNITKTVDLQPNERLDVINENLRLIQKTDGLTFGTDAYLLAAFAKASPKSALVDLGSGTGVASLLCLTRNKYRHAYAVEIQSSFCELIGRNTMLNGMDDRVTVLENDVRALSQADVADTVSTVISNPPYMVKGAGFSSTATEMEIARRECNGNIGDFCAAASRLLTTGGNFYTVFRPDRLPELISALRNVKLEPKRMITVYPDIESRPCLVLVESKKDAAPTLLHAPPLIIYKSSTDRTYTDAMARVYDTFSLEFLFDVKKGADI